jgi:uncharacterized membrane protein
VLLIFFWIFEANLQQLPAWMQVAGRLHPMVLHFPISILILVALLELIGPRDSTWKDKIELLLSITAFSASLAAICGLLLFHSGGYENGPDLYWHKLTGIFTALLSGILVWLRNLKKIIYYPALIGGVIIIVVAGHLGSSITHGSGFITAPLISKTTKIKDLNKAQIFTDIIQPIINEKCIGCHNPNKTKGGLLLTDKQTIMKGGEDGVIIVPGSPDSSILYQFLLLPLMDEKHMPPEGKPQVDKEEIAIFKWWIVQGAEFDKSLSEIPQPDSIQSIIRAKYGAGSPLDEMDIAFADDKTIQSLNNTRRGVKQLSLDKPYISVFLANRKDLTPKDLEELQPVQSQVISIDLSHTTLRDQDLKALNNFPHLQKLYLENTGISDTGIAYLKGMTYLEYLNISGNRISGKVLSTLKQFGNLKKVFFYETNIPASSLIAFQTSIPGMKVGFTPDLSTDTLFRGKLTDPTVKIDSNMFLNSAKVEMNYRLKGVDLRYTTNGKEPDSTSATYSDTLIIDSNAVLKVVAMRKGWQNSPVQTFNFRKAAMRFIDAKLDSAPDKRYLARLDTTVIDLQKGSLNHTDGKYIGYYGTGMIVKLDLGEARQISSIDVGYISNHNALVMAPTKMELWGSNEKDGAMKKLGVITHKDDSLKKGATLGSMKANFRKQSLRYLQVKLTNMGKTPKWHPAKDQKTWIFIDEILAE